MISLCPSPLLILAFLAFLGGCATRPINPPITQVDPHAGYRFETRQANIKDKDNMVILAFSDVLPPEAVDRLRAAAGTIILDSPEFKRLLKDVGSTIISGPAAGAPTPAKAGAQ